MNFYRYKRINRLKFRALWRVLAGLIFVFRRADTKKAPRRSENRRGNKTGGAPFADTPPDTPSTTGGRAEIIILRIITPDKIAATESEDDAVDKPLRLAPSNTTAPCLALCDDLRLKRGKLTFQIALLKFDFFAKCFQCLQANVRFFSGRCPTRNSVPHCEIG